MYNISEIRELIKLLDSTNITELEIENDGAKLSIKKSKKEYVEYIGGQTELSYVPPAVNQMISREVHTEIRENTAKEEPVVATQNYLEIKSPMVGTFYSAPSPDAPAFVKIGDHVTDKNVVCIIEAMKLMNEIEAECSGKIVEVCVENGQLVEYGQTLFKVSKE